MKPLLHGLVLAGGHSSRMGRDKAALVHADGRTLARRCHDLLREAGNALIRRDPATIEALLRKVDSWLQIPEESEAQVNALSAMLEAAYLLEGEPSELVELTDDMTEAEAC
jgi:molybdopterin-guanine dinucleotide biosynthesis protein A